MNAQRHLRIATIASIFLFLVLAGFALFAGTTQSIAARGNTGNALAILGVLKIQPAAASSAPARKVSAHYVYDLNSFYQKVEPRAGAAAAAGSRVDISEPVQTFDVLAPAPSFIPPTGTDLTATNLEPCWSKDEQYIIFSSNRKSGVAADPVGNYHLWFSLSDGSAPIQLTSGAGNEYFPVLSPTNNYLAFVSSFGSSAPVVRNLYVIPFNPQGAQSTPPVIADVSKLTSLSVRTDLTTGFGDVQRPAWSASEDRIAFPALTNVGSDKGHYHIYYLYVSSRGYRQTGQGGGLNPPGKITAGLEDDTDLAWTADGRYLVFSSNSAGFTNTGQDVNPSPDNLAQQTTPVVSSGITSPVTRSLFVLTSNGTVPALAGSDLTSTGGRITNSGGVDSGPACSFPNSRTDFFGFIQDFTGYIAFARLSPTIPTSTARHYDIYYMPLVDQFTGGLNTEATAPLTRLNTDDPSNAYDDQYPTWSPLVKHFSIAYESNRSISYNDANNVPLEIARSIPRGTPPVGPNYTGVLESQINNLDPPTLLPFSGDEIVHTQQKGTAGASRLIAPLQTVTITVRLSNRESGVDDNNVYVQIKDPDSKYQDSQSREHKLFTKDEQYAFDHPVEANLTAADQLYNGGAGNSTVTIDANGVKATYTNRGALGGVDGDHFITVGTNGGGINQVGDPNNPVILPGGDPDKFIPWGQEYECQYVNAQFATGNKIDTAPTDYGTPRYVAGADDIVPGSAPATPEATWLKLSKAAVQDGQGGVLYTADWKTPASASDYYLDVIAYDNASNWRIYDNVWGFTTLQFAGGHKILVVSDNALGQKFAASTYGLNGAISNLAPTFYGAESYYTDVDVNILPDSVYLNKNAKGSHVPPITGDPVDLKTVLPHVQPLGFPTVSVADTAENTLGVGSYDGQQYDLWRILSRGPVNEGILLGYGPDIKVTQPAVPALNEPAAQFTPSSHCVIWATPYTRDLLVGPGSFGSTITQTLIKKFLDSGGRLFVAGQDVAATLTSNGTFNNTPGTGFLPDYLGATYLQPKAATDVLAGISGAGHRVSFDAFFNYNAPLGVRQNFPKVTGIRDDGFVSFDYSAPSDNALILGHYRFANGVYTPDSRTDAPLNHQLFPGLFFGGPSFTDQNPEIAKIDTIAPSAQSQTDITFSGPAGLITHEDRAKGSRVVFSSFGLEGIGLEYYKVNNSKLGDFYFVLNQRPRLMHNIVTYLRTGTITGTITDTTGNNGAGSKVSGVLVYLTANENVTIPGMPVGRTVYSAITDANGNYRIDAVEPGAYLVHATKTGYSAATTEPFVNVVTANQLTTVNLDITPFIPGGITGKVTYKDKTPVIGADVLFTAPDGSIVSGQTNAQGVYTIGSVPPGTYTGVASKGVAKSATITITVASGITTANADFVLDAAASPGSLTGVVKNTAGTPLVGATVSATLTGASTSTTVTTKTGGTYSFPSLPPGVYKVTASFPPTYGAVTVQLTIAASTAATQNFTLGAAKSAQLGGLITSASGTPLGGLTVTATPVGGGTVKTFVTSPTATTSPLGTTTSDHGTKINWSGPLPEGIYDITVKSGGVVSTIESGFAVTSVKFNQTRDFAFASIHTFTAGLHMISSPYDYSGASLDSLFGTNRSKLVIWQPKLLQYVLDPTPPADGLHPGYGYWIRLPNAVDITVAGTKPTGSSVPIALYPFWNQIGNPGTGQVPITSLKFLNPLTNTQLTYAQASSAQYNLISPTIYGYDPQTNAYVKVTTLEPWQGYWIKAYSNTTVSIPIINATTTP